MSDVDYSCRHSRAGGNPKALRYFFALRFPTDSYRYKLGMTTIHVEAYKTACCINTSMVGTACPDISSGKDPQAMKRGTSRNRCPKRVLSGQGR